MRLTLVVAAVVALAVVAECQYRRLKYREDNYYERLYKRRMAEEEMQKFSQTAFQRRLGTAYTTLKFPSFLRDFGCLTATTRRTTLTLHQRT